MKRGVITSFAVSAGVTTAAVVAGRHDVVAILLAVVMAGLGTAGGFAVGWTAREHQIERRIRRSTLPPARITKASRPNHQSLMPIESRYILVLRCRFAVEPIPCGQTDEFTGTTASAARHTAKAQGWAFSGGDVACPRCTNRGCRSSTELPPAACIGAGRPAIIPPDHDGRTPCPSCGRRVRINKNLKNNAGDVIPWHHEPRQGVT